MPTLHLLNMGYQAKAYASANDPTHYGVLYSLVNFHETLLEISHGKYDMSMAYSFFPRDISKSKLNKDVYLDHLKYFGSSVIYGDEDLCIIIITAHGSFNQSNKTYNFLIDNNTVDDKIYGYELRHFIMQIAAHVPCFVIGNTCGFDSDLIIDEQIKNHLLSFGNSDERNEKDILLPDKFFVEKIPIDIYNLGLSSNENILSFSAKTYPEKVAKYLGKYNHQIGVSPNYTVKFDNTINHPVIVLGSIHDSINSYLYARELCKILKMQPDISYLDLLTNLIAAVLPMNNSVILHSLSMLTPPIVKYEEILSKSILSS